MTFKNFVFVAFSALNILMLSSCASVIDGSTQVVVFTSTPAGAEVILDGQAIGITPLTAELERSGSKLVTVRMNGYNDQVIVMSTEFNPTVFGNIITGGTTGSSTDSTTGASLKYSPNSYHASLVATAASEEEARLQQIKWGIARYIMVSYPRLLDDLARGEGEHLDALYDALAVADVDQSSALRRVREIAAIQHQIPTFADAIVAEFGVN
jgi:hypothetical protein